MNRTYGRITVIEVDLDGFNHNLQQFRQIIPSDVSIMAVVKANAYGHGAVPIAKAALEAGVTHIAVAFVDEGIELREAGIKVPIFILGYTPRDALRDAILYDLSMSVYTINDLQAIEDMAAKIGHKASIHIAIDTGMSRIGLQIEEVTPFLQTLIELKYIKTDGMFTHFACADEKDKTYTYSQQEIFQEALHKAKELNINIPWIHSYNSAATMDMGYISGNMVRLGIALYGLYQTGAIR